MKKYQLNEIIKQIELKLNRNIEYKLKELNFV